MEDAKPKAEPVAWRWKVPIPKEIQGSKFAWQYAGHWSTAPMKAEVQPLFAAHQPAASDVPHDVVRAPDLRCKVCGELPIAGAICTRFDCPSLSLATPAPSTSTEEALRAENARLKQVLEPFARVAEHDIGTDETDDDLFRPFHSLNRAPRLTVGHLRAALSALSR